MRKSFLTSHTSFARRSGNNSQGGDLLAAYVLDWRSWKGSREAPYQQKRKLLRRLDVCLLVFEISRLVMGAKALFDVLTNDEI